MPTKNYEALKRKNDRDVHTYSILRASGSWCQIPPESFAILARGHADDPAKCICEGTLVAEPAVQSDFGKGTEAAGKSIGGGVDAGMNDELLNRHADCLMEQTLEVPF